MGRGLGQRGDGRHVPAGVSGGAAAQGVQEGDARRACHGVPRGHHPRALHPAAAALSGPTGRVGRPEYVAPRARSWFCFFEGAAWCFDGEGVYNAHTGWAPDRPSSPDGAPAYPNPPRPPSPPMQTVASLLSGPLLILPRATSHRVTKTVINKARPRGGIFLYCFLSSALSYGLTRSQL